VTVTKNSLTIREYCMLLVKWGIMRTANTISMEDYSFFMSDISFHLETSLN
jgi:hypothetical protein